MDKRSVSRVYLLLVVIPYVVLLGITAHAHSRATDELAHGLPRILIWIPAAISAILPVTYGGILFFFREHLKFTHTLLLGFFMAVALLVMAFVINLIGSP